MTKTVKTVAAKAVKAKPAAKKTTTKKTAAKAVGVAKKKVTGKAEKKPATPAVHKKPVAKVKQLASVDVIAQAMLDKKAQEVVSLDLTSLGTAICDHFVICHADSTIQVLAVADNVEKEMHERLHENPRRAQGKENAFWIIIDYTDVVVHIFQTEYRRFYRLEDLWADAGRKNYDE
jgi:ribosome-associated protein